VKRLGLGKDEKQEEIAVVDALVKLSAEARKLEETLSKR
jgi:hypothetical protein